MNFGQNLYNWFLSNAQSLVLMAIAVIGVYLGFNVSRWRPYRICRFNMLVLAATLDWCWTGKNQIRKEWYYDI